MDVFQLIDMVCGIPIWIGMRIFSLQIGQSAYLSGVGGVNYKKKQRVVIRSCIYRRELKSSLRAFILFRRLRKNELNFSKFLTIFNNIDTYYMNIDVYFKKVLQKNYLIKINCKNDSQIT